MIHFVSLRFFLSIFKNEVQKIELKSGAVQPAKWGALLASLLQPTRHSLLSGCFFCNFLKIHWKNNSIKKNGAAGADNFEKYHQNCHFFRVFMSFSVKSIETYPSYLG